MHDGETRLNIVRFYRDGEKASAKGPIPYFKEEVEVDAELVAIDDFQVLVEVPDKELTFAKDSNSLTLKRASFNKFTLLFHNQGKSSACLDS